MKSKLPNICSVPSFNKGILDELPMRNPPQPPFCKGGR